MTGAQVRELVTLSLQPHSRPLALAFEDAAFDGDPPPTWGEWPTPTKRAWGLAVRLYDEGRAARGWKANRRANAKLTPARVWLVLCESSQVESIVHRLSWADIAQRLDMSARAAQRQLRNMGFRFEGIAGTERRPKEVVAGPCCGCGAVLPAGKLAPTYHCASCRVEGGQNVGQIPYKQLWVRPPKKKPRDGAKIAWGKVGE